LAGAHFLSAPFILSGDMTIDYGGQLVEIGGTVLFFVNPKVPHSIVRRVKRTSGYALLVCVLRTPFSGEQDCIL
jgi:mannose-6-phosphate isomerase-like protein (cupin superfamily)